MLNSRATPAPAVGPRGLPSHLRVRALPGWRSSAHQRLHLPHEASGPGESGTPRWRLRLHAMPAPLDPPGGGLVLEGAAGSLWMENAEALGFASRVDADALPALALACLPPALSERLGQPSRVVPDQPVPPDALWVLLDIEDGEGLVHRCRTAARRSYWNRLVEAGGWTPVAAATEPVFLPTLPLDFVRLAGQCLVRVADLNALRVGDALLVADALDPDSDTCRLEAGPLALHLERQGDSAWTFSHWSHTMNPTDAAAGGPASPSSPAAPMQGLDGVPIELQFVLGRLRATVGQLREFAPGRVLHFTPNGEHHVEVVANGTVIAMGELVEIDGTLAVELSRLQAPPLA